MPGYLTDGLPTATITTGAELLYADGPAVAGQASPSQAITLAALSVQAQYYGNTLSKTLVAGSRYFTQFNYTGAANTTLTGLQVLIGGTGGTDKWLVELHNAAGALVATSALAGATVGTASTWQQFAFTSTFSLAPGTYWVAVQTNGTTATLATYNAPIFPLFTGSATGTFGTSASITPPTTYTANLGPVITPY